MSAEILRMGDPSDRGPNGEFGACVVYKDGDHSTGITVHCSEKHRHSRECVIAAVKTKVKIGERQIGEKDVTVGFEKDGEGNDDPAKPIIRKEPVMEDVLESPLERAKREVAARVTRDAELAAAPLDVEPLPKKTVQRDNRNVEVDDRGIANSELA